MRKLVLSLLFLAALVHPARADVVSTKFQGLGLYAADPFTCSAQTRAAQYYNTAGNTLYYCNGTSWTLIASGVISSDITIGTTAIVSGTNTRVLFDNAGVVGESANFTWVSPALTIGAAGVTGALKIAGLTSGTATLVATAIAGTPTVTLPNASSTLPIFGQQITFTGPTAARSFALVDAADTFAFLGQTQTFTGVNTFSQDAASTNTPLYPFICLRTSSGTPAIAMGCGFSATLENASNTNKDAGSVEFVWADPVNATEDADFVIKLMAAGAARAEKFRLSSTGAITGISSVNGSGTFTVGAVNSAASLNAGAASWMGFTTRSFFVSPADGVLAATYNDTVARAYVQQAGSTRVTTDITNATTTFAAITGLTTPIISGRKYAGRMVIRADNSLPADGIKLDFNGGAATVSAFWAACHIDVGGTAVAVTQISTSLAGVINWSTITGDTYIACDVSFVASSTNTFIPRQAGNAAVSGTLTTRVGTYWDLHDIQ